MTLFSVFYKRDRLMRSVDGFMDKLSAHLNSACVSAARPSGPPSVLSPAPPRGAVSLVGGRVICAQVAPLSLWPARGRRGYLPAALSQLCVGVASHTISGVRLTLLSWHAVRAARMAGYPRSTLRARRCYASSARCLAHHAGAERRAAPRRAVLRVESRPCGRGGGRSGLDCIVSTACNVLVLFFIM